MKLSSAYQGCSSKISKDIDLIASQSNQAGSLAADMKDYAIR